MRKPMKRSAMIIRRAWEEAGYQDGKRFCAALGMKYPNFSQHMVNPGTFSARQLAAIVGETGMGNEDLGKLFREIQKEAGEA